MKLYNCERKLLSLIMTETADCLFPHSLESNNAYTNEGKHYTKMTFYVRMRKSKSSTIWSKMTLQKIKVIYIWNLTTYVKYLLGYWSNRKYFFPVLSSWSTSEHKAHCQKDFYLVSIFYPSNYNTNLTM